MSKNLPLKILLLGTLTALLLTAGAQYVCFGGEELTVKPLSKLADADIPGKILIWLDRGKHDEGYGAFFEEGRLYLAARMGECPTGGYAIYLGNPRMEGDSAVVTVEYQKPSPWDIVIHALTYPRTVSQIVVAKRPKTALFLTPDGAMVARVEVVGLDEE